MFTNSSRFAPEVSEYMKLNGFTLITHDLEIDLIAFRKDDLAVLFWHDKVERRLVSNDKLAVNRTLKSFKGFDGQNIFKLMLILHLIDAINLKDISNEIYRVMGTNVDDELQKEFHLHKHMQAH